ncbi:DUF2510 domain-containing protein [Kribbella sp. NBC_00709]|uniref:DUF2510 domain-containing protein n=1 Tax=Kribbella sp. NBC_00709 TaxID=2975972 RepID=UPI002E2CA211|nr:DUF2510 domain-containing protein [Kribbella sp. NBC_00709]
MSNPPAGWYPDPTGQPNIIRFWNGEKWTNQTEHEDPEPAPEKSHQNASTPPLPPEPVSTEPVGQVSTQPVGQAPDAEPEAPGPGLRSVQESQDDAESVGWWQPTPTPQLWDLDPADGDVQANGGPRLRAVTHQETAQEAGPTPAERAQATWGAPEIAAAPPEHWTQREFTEEELEAEQGTAGTEVPTVQAEEPSAGWTLKLAPAPSPADGADEDADSAEPWSDVSWTEQPRFAPTPKEDAQPVAAASDAAAAEVTADLPAVGVAAADVPGAEVPGADVSAQDAEVQAADAAQVAAQLQPDWGSQAGDEQDQQSSDQPSWGVEVSDEDDQQTPDHPAAPLWSMPAAADTTQEQPTQVQMWGDQPQEQNGRDQSWNGQQGAQPEQGQSWGAEQPAPWGQQATAETQNGQPTGDQAWSGQSWPVQQTGDQQNGNGWSNDQQNGSPSWDGQQNTAPTQEDGAQSWANNGHQSGNSWAGDQQGSGQSWGDGQQGGQSWGDGQQGGQQQWGGPQSGGQVTAGVQQGGVQQGVGPQGFQQGGGQQAWEDQQTPRAWGEDENESWGGQTDLSSGVGKRDKGKSKKPKSSGGGGGQFGAKLPLIVGGGIALAMLIVAAVFLITSSGDDKKADPGPTTSPQPTGSPTNQSSTKPGQSKNPKLHEGTGRISSDAISFPRRNPPWSDRKRLVQQLLDSSGQHIVLQENVNGADDWTADIFVGGLGTGSGFNGDPKATAAALSVQLRTGMYGSIPATYRTVASGAVKRTDKSGWFFQQTVTATSAAVTDRVLTLTVAVFDLGDGTAVAYISGIPNNRPDLKAAESQAYKGINVG